MLHSYSSHNMPPEEDTEFDVLDVLDDDKDDLLIDSIDESSTQQHPKYSELIVILVAVFVHMLSFGILFPILPFMALKFHASGAMVGFVFSSYNVLNFIGSTVLGRVSDKIGRKPVLFLSLAGATAGQIILGFSNSLIWIFISRIVAGFSGGSTAVAQAYIADLTTDKDRTKYLGYLGAAAGLGLVCGPAVGGLLSGFGFSWVAFSAALISGPNAILALFILKEPSKLNITERSLTLTDLARIASERQLLALLLVQFLASFSFAGLEVSLSLFGYKQFGMTSTTAGVILAVYGVAMVIIQGGFVRISRKYFQDRLICTLALVGFGATLISTAFVPNFAWLFVVVTLNAVCYGFYSSTMAGLSSTSAPSDVQGNTMLYFTHLEGFVLGLFASMSSLGRMLCPSIAGAVMDANPKAAFLMIGALSFCGALVLKLSAWGQKSDWQPVSTIENVVPSELDSTEVG